MILLNTNGNDPDFFNIVNWMYYFGKEFKIITCDEPIKLKNIKIDYDGVKISFEDDLLEICTSYWNRKSDLNIYLFNNLSLDCVEEVIYRKQYLSIEFPIILEFINENLISYNILNLEKKNKTNKLVNLSIAQKIGLKIPNTLITNCKKELEEFYVKNNKLITKPINSGHFTIGNEIYSQNTILISNLDEIDDKFYPSLFQQYINKKFEIRSFYIRGLFKSIAIFSQNDQKTMIDFRNYNFEKPNRCVPINLPHNITFKLQKLMIEIGLITGSIDLIYNDNNEFVFLEVNPEGIFNNVSVCGNYFIEKDIASIM